MWEVPEGSKGPIVTAPVSNFSLSPCSVPLDEEDEPSEPPTTTPEPPPRPRLGKLTVTDATPDSLSLSWTIPEGQFDHFLIQHKNGDGQPKVVRVPGHEDQVTISGLEPGHKYKMNLYGFHSGQRMGPVSAIGMTGEWTVGDPGWDLVERGPS
jgi:syndecan 4